MFRIPPRESTGRVYANNVVDEVTEGSQVAKQGYPVYHSDFAKMKGQKWQGRTFCQYARETGEPSEVVKSTSENTSDIVVKSK